MDWRPGSLGQERLGSRPSPWMVSASSRPPEFGPAVIDGKGGGGDGMIRIRLSKNEKDEKEERLTFRDQSVSESVYIQQRL